MKNSKKRGFTIVELVIVIAVIAILAGVLIPTFVSVIKKGQEANDTALIKYLNTSLTAGTIGGKAPETMQGALDIVEADGYNVAKIKATASGARILWDSKNNCFVYLKDGENEPTYIPDSKTQNVANVDYWQITEADEDLSGKYSNYLALGYTKDLSNVQTGLDVGQNENIAAITYKGTGTEQKVAINTNGGELTVDAQDDTIYHYGSSDNVNVISCAMDSYHVFAKITGTITLTHGNVEIESTGSVAAVNIVATSSSEFAVSNSKGGNLSMITATNPEVISSSGDNKNVTVPENTGIMTVENKDAVAYSEQKGFLKQWDKALGNGKTILLKDLEDKAYHVSVQSTIEATFDINGHRFRTDNSGASVTYGKLTFMDSSLNETGLYYSKVNFSAKQQNGLLVSNGKKAVLTVNSGHIEAYAASGEFDNNKGQFGVAIWNGATIIINGGTIKAAWYALVGNGNDVDYTSTIIINGGKLISVYDYAMYLPHNGVSTINGGVVDGAAGAISLMRGTLTINGGQFMSDGTGDVGTWGDGTGAIGVNSLIVISKNYGACSLLVNGGDYRVAASCPIIYAENNEYDVSIIISAGTYNKNVDKWVSSAYTCVDNGDGTWTVVKK